jgi:hypothetical protein
MVELFGVRANPIFATARSLFGREFVTVRDGVDQNSVIAVVERVPSGAVNAPSRGGSSPRRANPPDGRAAAQIPNGFSDHALRRLFGLGNSIEARRSPEVVCTRREIAWCRVKRCCICRRARVASFDGFRASDQKVARLPCVDATCAGRTATMPMRRSPARAVTVICCIATRRSEAGREGAATARHPKAERSETPRPRQRLNRFTPTGLP